MKKIVLAGVFFVAGIIGISGTTNAQQLPADIPGLVAGLSHTRAGKSATWKQMRDALPSNLYHHGHDQGGDRNDHFTWFSIINPGAAWTPEMISRIPPGLVFGLKHTMDSDNQHILAFNTIDASHDWIISNLALRRPSAGDIGAPRNEGYKWIKSTSSSENVDWSLIDRLPRYTIMGLRHTMNLSPQKDYYLQIFWQGRYSCSYHKKQVPCDCTNESILPPPGFIRRGNIDLGAPKGEGFCWYEKRN